jgi:hypothetical protein
MRLARTRSRTLAMTRTQTTKRRATTPSPQLTSSRPAQVFPGTTWDDIAADPLPYVNAQWSEEPPGYYLAPWLHGHLYRHGWPRYPSD